MDKYLDVNNITKKKLIISKPFWNDELTCLWKDMRRHQKTFLRQKYQSGQKLLDKKIRQYERKYEQNQILEIERLKLSITLMNSGNILRVWALGNKILFL